MILDAAQDSHVQAAALALQRGELLGLPTETVYGLAADADNATAVARIFSTKGRPSDHPLIVHVADSSAVRHYARTIPVFAQQLMAAFWPGPLTLIVPRQPDAAMPHRGVAVGKIALACAVQRIQQHKRCLPPACNYSLPSVDLPPPVPIALAVSARLQPNMSMMN